MLFSFGFPMELVFSIFYFWIFIYHLRNIWLYIFATALEKSLNENGVFIVDIFAVESLQNFLLFSWTCKNVKIVWTKINVWKILNFKRQKSRTLTKLLEHWFLKNRQSFSNLVQYWCSMIIRSTLENSFLCKCVIWF